MAIRLLFTSLWSLVFVSLRRAVRGPLWPGWAWRFEWANDLLKRQTRDAARLPDMASQRGYADTLVYTSPALERVTVEPELVTPVPATWYVPENCVPGRVVLYLHGGGWAFYSKAHHGLIANVAVASRARTLAVDYRLSPEHPYPAAVDDCLAAYWHLLRIGVEADQLVLGGDSAGGNLALALLQALREGAGPLPALAFLISPVVDVADTRPSLETNSRFDWVDAQEVRTWCAWYAAGADPKDPMVSPLYADLAGLPPIYAQAGSAEVIVDQIRAFVEAARGQGAQIQFDVWDGMTHDFQAYGDELAQSREALQRLGQAVAASTGTRTAGPSVATFNSSELQAPAY